MEIQNRKARFDYEIIDNYVAGLVLQGTETKQIRLGHCTLVDSWCGFIKNELWVYNMEVTTANTAFQHDPKRLKKLLLNKDELKKLQKSLIKGLTIIPLRIIEKNGKFKLEIALARGKNMIDKRQTIKDRDQKRERAREGY